MYTLFYLCKSLNVFPILHQAVLRSLLEVREGLYLAAFGSWLVCTVESVLFPSIFADGHIPIAFAALLLWSARYFPLWAVWLLPAKGFRGDHVLRVVASSFRKGSSEAKVQWNLLPTGCVL